MSLTIEKMQIEAKINALEKENAMAEITGDMAIMNIRAEASTMLDIEEIDMDKVDAGVAMLHSAIERKRHNAAEIKRLRRML